MESSEIALDFAFVCLCVQSEDEKDKSAQELITEIIFNRSKSKKYPSMLFNVITQKKQFSYFNSVGGLRRNWQSLDLLADGTNPITLRPIRRVDWTKAAESVIKKVDLRTMTLREHKRVLHPDYLFMYAPKSMTNKTKEPSWWKFDVSESYVHNEWVFGKAE